MHNKRDNSVPDSNDVLSEFEMQVASTITYIKQSVLALRPDMSRGEVWDYLQVKGFPVSIAEEALKRVMGPLDFPITEDQRGLVLQLGSATRPTIDITSEAPPAKLSDSMRRIPNIEEEYNLRAHREAARQSAAKLRDLRKLLRDPEEPDFKKFLVDEGFPEAVIREVVPDPQEQIAFLRKKEEAERLLATIRAMRNWKKEPDYRELLANGGFPEAVIREVVPDPQEQIAFLRKKEEAERLLATIRAMRNWKKEPDYRELLANGGFPDKVIKAAITAIDQGKPHQVDDRQVVRAIWFIRLVRYCWRVKNEDSVETEIEEVLCAGRCDEKAIRERLTSHESLPKENPAISSVDSNNKHAVDTNNSSVAADIVVDQIASMENTPDQGVERIDLLDQQMQAIRSACHDKLDLAIINGRLTGKAYQQIAEEYGLKSPNMVAQRFHRIKERVKLRWGEGSADQSFGVTSDRTNVNITADTQASISVNGLESDKQPPEHNREAGKDAALSSVLALMKQGAKLDDIRKHIRESIALATENLASELNKWLAAQDPPDRAERMTLGEKQAIVEFLTLIGEAMQQPLFWRGEECRVEAFGDPDYESGYLRVRTPGAKTGFTKAKLSDILKEAPFGFDKESSLWPPKEVATDQTASEGEEKVDRNWARKASKRKSESSKKKPHR